MEMMQRGERRERWREYKSDEKNNREKGKEKNKERKRRREMNSGRFPKGRAIERKREREKRLSSSWIRGWMVVVVVSGGVDRQIPWIERGKVDEGRRGEKEEAAGELNVCKLNVPRLYLAREFRGAREEATRARPRNGILSNKAARSRE